MTAPNRTRRVEVRRADTRCTGDQRITATEAAEVPVWAMHANLAA